MRARSGDGRSAGRPSLITPFRSKPLLGIDRALAAHGHGLLVGRGHRRSS